MNYNGETSIETASIETAQLLINSTLLTKGAKFMAIDISNFYIQNDLDDYQYIRFSMNMIPQETIEEYNLNPLYTKMDTVMQRSERQCMDYKNQDI